MKQPYKFAVDSCTTEEMQWAVVVWLHVAKSDNKNSGNKNITMAKQNFYCCY